MPPPPRKNKELCETWSEVRLRDVCEIKKGSAITRKTAVTGKYPVIAGGRIPAYYHNEYNRENETITVSASGAYAGFVGYHDRQIYASDCSTVQAHDSSNGVFMRWLYFCLKSRQSEIYKLQTGMAQPHVYRKDIENMIILLPSLSEQKRIVVMLDKQLASVEQMRQAIVRQIEANSALESSLLRQALFA